jgi:ribosomal-protein-alanine N-acetyltransferase
MRVEILTERFRLRSLQESDASERYLSWMQDPAARRYIVAAATTRELADLRDYVRERVGRDDVLFLGIFEKDSELHIGNLKFEPIDVRTGEAVMGILIGDPAWRGKGVTTEVLGESGRWLKQHRGIRRIMLGVEQDNTAAIRAYERVGFVVSGSKPGGITMTWTL